MVVKDASPFTATGKFLGRAGVSALSRTVKGLGKTLWGGSRFVVKRPGVALTGAFTAPVVGNYIDKSRASTMGRRLPKLASEAVIDGFIEKLGGLPVRYDPFVNLGHIVGGVAGGGAGAVIPSREDGEGGRQAAQAHGWGILKERHTNDNN